jgi:DNA mismatch endonuclease, patch repair protein
MVDIVSREVRSRMMSGIQAKNTKPEMLARRALFAAGYRFRLHRKDLPGKPDIVLPRHKAVIMIHGCFWHMHQACSLAKTPSTRRDFWTAKLNANALRDEKSRLKLLELGWRVLTVWECYLRAVEPKVLQADLTHWISGTKQIGELSAGLTAKA